MRFRLSQTALVLGTVGVSQLLGSQDANADLLRLERWATNQGSWVPPSVFLPGDFDGNGKTDLAYVYISCYGCLAPFEQPGGPLNVFVGIDEHLACDNHSVACPAGVPNSQVSGAFALRSAVVSEALPPLANLNQCDGNILGLGSECDVITGQKLAWLSGDFNGDGYSDVAFVFSSGGQIQIWVGVNGGAGTPYFHFTQWAANQGAWIADSTWVAGDFNGDGKSDLAYVFKDGGLTSIDVHQSLGGTLTGGGFALKRFLTRTGGWVSPASWQAGDFNEDGRADLGLAWDDGGGIDLDVNLSTGTSFYGQRWATNQGAWLSPGQWTSVLGVTTTAPSASMIPWWASYTGVAEPAVGSMIFAFNDGGNISIDTHLVSSPNTFGPAHFVNQRYATRQGTYPDEVQFVGGDFNGDGVGDVADAFQVDGDIDIDVHAGVCRGPLTPSGTCCAANAAVCNGSCCNGTCSTSLSAVNGCCPTGKTCPPPPPPRFTRSR